MRPSNVYTRDLPRPYCPPGPSIAVHRNTFLVDFGFREVAGAAPLAWVTLREPARESLAYLVDPGPQLRVEDTDTTSVLRFAIRREPRYPGARPWTPSKPGERWLCTDGKGRHLLVTNPLDFPGLFTGGV